MKQTYQIIIIGSGFGGQMAAINLNRQGFDDYLILERRDFMGGTWSQNVYPGAAVDVPSPLYSLSFEPYHWTQLYADRAELNDYTDHIIEKYQLKPKTRTSSNVEKITWLEDKFFWEIQLTGSTPFYAQFIINATGPLSTPVIPNFKGKSLFKGKSFHSNHWDTQYDYKNKRVAIIGSGASAAQIIPAIAEDVNHLYIFQRSPHWVIPRNDYVFKKWQRKLLSYPWCYKSLRVIIYWMLEYRMIGFKYSQKMLNLLGRNHAEKLIKRQISDKALRKKVLPDFEFGCKRVVISDTLYPAYCRDNVTLIDKNNPIKEITETGITTEDETQIALDLIVYATGYDATDGVISYPVIGVNGQSLSDFWQDYPRAYLGTSMPGFPNLFIISGPNTNVGHTSALFLMEAQIQYILHSLKQVKAQKQKVIEVTSAAEHQYTERIHKEMTGTVWNSGRCNSWYKNKAGKVTALFPGFSFTFRRWTNRFKQNDHVFYGTLQQKKSKEQNT